MNVLSIKRTDEFNAWLLGLKDGMTHRRLLARLRKASLGNLGDVKSVGSGLFEMREHLARAGACTTCSGAPC